MPTMTMPAPVKFDPPVSLGSEHMPSCPACGGGTRFLRVCGSCGSTDDSPAYCCGESMLVSGAFVSLLPGLHSWLGCHFV
jgi:hypothetical protein